jgi:transposase-like protein
MACALREVFGSKVAIQRCRIHKKRNILAKIPASERAAVEAQLESAWKGNDEILCRARLELLARGLEARGRREAAASVREGLRESLTCTRLAIPVGLHASLMNTNVIESAFSQHESTAHRVKRWQNGQQLVRWVGIALQRAEQSFASVADPDLLRRLSEAMDNFAAGSVAQPQRVGKQAPARSQVEHLRPPSLAA